MREQTLALIKPDGVRKNLVEIIEDRYLAAGLLVTRQRTHRMDEGQVIEFYREHQNKAYFDGLVLAMTSGPIVALVLIGEDAIKKVRELNGVTDPRKAAPGTIRHDFPSADGPFNIVHGSDSPEAVQREIEIVFRRTD